jgi:hypothetical protein
MIRQFPKGDRISGLVPLSNFRPEFQALVSYGLYRLAGKDPIVDAEVTDCLHSYLNEATSGLTVFRIPGNQGPVLPTQLQDRGGCERPQ